MTKVIYASHKRKARFEPPDPSLIKKRSNYEHAYLNRNSANGEEQQPQNTGPIGMRGGEAQTTPTGQRLPGFVGKYEVFREVMAPGAVGAKLRHPKKTRTIVAISGMGSILVEGPDEESRKFARLVPGDEITLKAGDSYQLFTTTKSHLEYLVCQESKYESSLETLEEAKELDVPADLLKYRSEEAPLEMQEMPQRRARNNKTAQLLWERKYAAALRAGGDKLQEFLANEGENAPTGTSPENVSNLVPEAQHEVPKANVSGGFVGVNADPKAILKELVSGSDYTEAELREAGLI